MSLFNRISGGRAPSNTGNNSNREVCKFYLEGRCRFGDQCRYYHPPRDQTPSQTRQGSLPYHLNVDSIRADLKDGEERPSWPLSAFGPGRDAPRQLLEGTLEQSPEELRVQYYLAKASGNTQQYEQSERDGYAQSNQQAQSILNDIDGAIKYVIDGKDQHPNREDMVIRGPPNFPWSEPASTGQIAQPASGSTFGRPSTFSRGTPFGQTSSPATQQNSTFGQPSAFGSNTAFGSQPQTGGSTFGQSSNLGAQQSSAFGAPSALGSGGSAFGRPSNMGAGTTAGSAFGQASALGGNSPFGSGQAAPNSQTTAFGQPSAPGSGSAFGKPSPFGAAATSNTSTFGQPSAPSQQQNSFGQSQQQSTFGQSSAPAQQSVFGQSSTPAQQQSTFGKPSPFGNAAAATGSSPFGQQSEQPNQPAFGGASNMGAAANGSTFGASSAPAQQTNPFGGGQAASTNSNPPFGSPAASRPAGQPPTSWKGSPVMKEDNLYFYRNAAGKQERIWFPEGPPGPNPDVEATPPDIYNDERVANVLSEIYSYVKEHGTFKDGLVPEIPPKRDWVSFDV